MCVSQPRVLQYLITQNAWCFVKRGLRKQQERAEAREEKIGTHTHTPAGRRTPKGLSEVNLPVVVWPYHESHVYCVMVVYLFPSS